MAAIRDLVAWYLVLAAIGAGGLLPAQLLWGGLRSGGLLYARPLALLLVAGAGYLASALTPLAYGRGLLLAAVVVLWAWSAWLGWRRPARIQALWSRRRLLLVGEVVVLALFALAVLVRAQAPDAQHTEKPMDLMILASVARADALPVEDAWFADHDLSYYYLGHVQVDALARLSGTQLGVAFTLGVATAAALAGAAAFALAGDLAALGALRRRASVWIAGGVALASLLALATLEGGIELLAANGLGGADLWGRLGVAGLPAAEGVRDGVPAEFWWWWRATRVLPQTITEFPAFSIILGDLHAHVLALPLAVLAIATVLPAFAGGTPLTWRGWLRNPGALLIAGALFAGLALTNAWDAAIYGALWGGATTVAFVGAGWPLHSAPLLALRYLALPAAVAVVLALPLLRTLDTPDLGVELFTARGSDPARLLLVWLPLLAPVAAAAVLLRPGPSRRAAVVALATLGAVVIAWLVLAVATGEGGAIGERGAGWLTLALLGAAVAATVASAAAAYRARDHAQAAWIACVAAAAAIVLLTELVFLRDALNDRSNTVFKFWFACWLLLAVGGGAGLALAYDRAEARVASAWATPAVAVAAMVYVVALLYAPAATVARGREGQQRGIDALAYLQRLDPGAAATARWAGALDGEATLLEAAGRDYTPGNVLSAASGVPTLLGWAGHQVQWRGNIALLSERQSVIARIYAGGATEEVRALAQEHGVTHIYLGREEQQQFGADVAARFAAWPTVFTATGARVVEVPGGSGEARR